jgi:hypothetical protein
MHEDSFIEKFKASLGDKSLAFSNTLGKVFSKEEPEVIIVDAPKVAIDKEDYELMAVSWKELGAADEREDIRALIKGATQIKSLSLDERSQGFIEGLKFILEDLDERDKNNG